MTVHEIASDLHLMELLLEVIVQQKPVTSVRDVSIMQV